MLPIMILRREIKNVYVRSFLHYVPYVTLSVMTFPAILNTGGSIWSALFGFAVAAVSAYRKASMFTVSLLACAAVFAAELLILR